MSLSDIAILNTDHAYYRCIINGISKSEAINKRKKWNIIKHKFSLSCIKDGYKNYNF